MTVEKLDAGLSKRPSRFDRKYCFENPSFEDRVRYCEYWRCARPIFVLPPIGYLIQNLVRSYLADLQWLHLLPYHVISLRSLMASALHT